MTTIAYVDCPSGVSGDMLLGAVLDAGVPLERLQTALSGLPLDGYTLEAHAVQRGALGATHARVTATRAEHAHRHLPEILALIAAATLPPTVKAQSTAVFRRLAEAEARVHRTPVEAVHFHEVGAVDAVVDIVGVCLGLEMLGVTALYASPLPLARGVTESAHGTLPLPAPAVLELLASAGAPTRPHPAHLELVTPTGAALLTTLAQFAQPALRLTRIGYGAGTRSEPAPNLLRLWLGEGEPAASGLPPTETLLVLEANIDDMPGELFGYTIERLLGAGALDAWCVPLTMKKSRPAVLLGALCRPQDRVTLVRLLLRETSTFGVRVHAVERYAAARTLHTVATPFGSVTVKLKELDGQIVGAAPEYEDCRQRAREHGAPLAQVYAAALAAAAPLLHPTLASTTAPGSGGIGDATIARIVALSDPDSTPSDDHAEV